MYQASQVKQFAPGHHGIRAHPRLTSGKTSKGHFGTQSRGCAGQTVRPSVSISADTAAMRSSNRRQSWTSSPMRLTILGDIAPVFELRMSGNALRNGTTPCRTMMPRSIRKPRFD
jgi:hypothetical protein